MRYQIKSLICLFFLALFLPLLAVAQNIQLLNLKTEYAERPMGIDITHPRFSWQMAAKEPGCRQTAWQVIVTNEKGEQLWNSGQKKGDVSLNIRYAGSPLQPRTRYSWTLQVWDHLNRKHKATSWFETGLMNTGLSAWNGAQWIGGSDDDMTFYAAYLPVFRINFTLQLDEATASTRAGFIYGANDERLMNSNRNLYKLQSHKDSSYILIALDIASLTATDPARLHIYRVGYAAGDKKDIPLKTFSIPASLVNKQNKYGKHTVHLSSVMGDTHIYMDGTDKQNLVGQLNLNPLGQGGDFIAYPVVGDIGFFVPAGQTAFFSAPDIRNYRSPSNVIFSEREAALKNGTGLFAHLSNNVVFKETHYEVTGKEATTWVVANPSRHAVPMLRTAFSLGQAPVAKARLYITSRGIYELFMNGKRIGNDYFNPGLTQYNKTHLYQTFDVTKEVLSGKNAMGAILAEGWWSGGATYMGEFWNFFGDRQSLLAQLVVTYADGREEAIVSKPDTWRYCNHGPVVYGSFFQGEVYDATKESLVTGWSTASFNDAGWKKSTVVEVANHVSRDERNKANNMPMVDDFSSMALVGQFGQTVQKVKTLTAVGVEKVRAGVFIYDMGQNMAGVPHIALHGLKEGARINLRFAEVKYPELPEYKDHVGMLMLENIRAAMAQDIYIAKGGVETIHPRFTYHGYRYVEIEGIDQPLPLNAVKGDVLSSVHEFTAKYESSSPEINKLWENITWSTWANFMSIPTDCPQRNERLGWSGDISVFSRTATYLADIPQFLRRHMQAMRDVQRADGRFTDVAPLGGGFGDVLWGSAGITVAWESFQQYGDVDLLKEHYDAMRSYVQFLIRNIDPQTGVLQDKDRGQWSSLGDWLSPEYEKTEKSLLWEAYFVYDLEVLSKIAAILDKKEDAESFTKLYVERKAFFNTTYVDKQTGKTAFRGKTIDTQASYAVPFQFNVFHEENIDAVRKNMAATITRENKADDGTVCPAYSLMTGFIGTAWINSALSDNGYSGLAYRLLQQTSYPSWLYPVKQGATTIWERLNSYTHVNGFGGNNRMNSFNHYSFGAVAAWLCDHSLGISRDENSPGFKHFFLQPEPDPAGKITFAQGHYDGMYGRIESSWRWSDSNCVYRFTVPANSSATLYLSAPSEKAILADNKPLGASNVVKLSGKVSGKYRFILPSGSYTFRVNTRNKK